MYISIAMATYNGARYLQEPLDSFLSQTRQPDKRVICDDGSTDATLDIVDAFRRESPFTVRVHSNETNLGFIKNFEKALSLCEGDIIFFSDQDDVWLNNKIKDVEQLFLTKDNVMVILNDQFVTDSNLSPSSHSVLSNISAAGVGESWFVAGCCTSVRKEFLPIIMPIPQGALGHDAWINKLAEALLARYVFATPLQYHRRHGDNTSAAFINKWGKLSSLDLIREYGIRDARQGWQRDIDHYIRYRDRIFERAIALHEFGLTTAGESAIAHFSEKIDILKSRIEMASLSRIRRLPKLIHFWKKGGYRHFSGWKSAVKDFLRT